MRDVASVIGLLVIILVAWGLATAIVFMSEKVGWEGWNVSFIMIMLLIGMLLFNHIKESE